MKALVGGTRGKKYKDFFMEKSCCEDITYGSFNALIVLYLSLELLMTAEMFQ